MKRILFLLIFTSIFISCNSSIEYDIIIKNGTILDGKGKESYQGDIGIKDDIIMTIGNLSNAVTQRSIDASNLVVSPGFIDLHAHLDPIM